MSKIMSKIAPILALCILCPLSVVMAQNEGIPPVEISPSGEISPSKIPALPPLLNAQPKLNLEADRPMGMHHLNMGDKPASSPLKKLTPTPKKEEIKNQAASPLLSPMDTPAPVPEDIKPKTYTVLSAKDALIAPDKLRPWANLAQTATASSKNDALNIIKAIEADRGGVPPQGLFLAAKVLADHDMMDEASVYFFVGQLRLSFDALRYPPYMSEDAKKMAIREQHKDPDQRQSANNTNVGIINPHEGVSSLAGSIGKPIIRWAMRHPEQMEKDLKAAAAWDSTAPYAYDTGYDVENALPFADWELNLSTARQAYFTSMQSLLNDMKKMNR